MYTINLRGHSKSTLLGGEGVNTKRINTNREGGIQLRANFLFAKNIECCISTDIGFQLLEPFSCVLFIVLGSEYLCSFSEKCHKFRNPVIICCAHKYRVLIFLKVVHPYACMSEL